MTPFRAYFFSMSLPPAASTAARSQTLSTPTRLSTKADAENALLNLGGVRRSGDSMTGDLSIVTSLYPSLFLMPTYNGTTNRAVFEGSYAGTISLGIWEDGTGNDRRMLEVRTRANQNSNDDAVVLRTCVGGTWNTYRLFHAGMATPIPVANGGTGGKTGKAALKSLGIFYADELPSTGTDGQICLVPIE